MAIIKFLKAATRRPLWRWVRFLRDVLVDFAVLTLGVLLALAIVEGKVPAGISAWMLPIFGGIVCVHIVTLYSRGVYSLNHRYFALHDFAVLGFSATLPGVLLAYFQYRVDLIGHPHSGVTSLFVVYLCISTGLLAALRMGYSRKEKLARVPDPQSSTKQIRTLIVGAGDAGELILSEIRLRQVGLVRVVGFVDDDERKQSLRIHGVRVLGRLDDIPEIAERCRVDEILITIPVASGELMRRLLQLCTKTTARVKTLPGLISLVSDGNPLIPQLREIQLEDLLRREPVPVDLSGISGYLNGERVLITGGGGSIGSELARQIAKMNPERLILVGRGENSIYEIEQELRQTAKIAPDTAIADVRDKDALAKIFGEFHPTVVFHTAAHKHVPLMEKYVSEAIKNNVLGTRNVAELSAKFGVKRFIQISTDKAVNPSSVMGATKRLCELVVCSLSRNSDTRFSIVRFGNVLGSRGSLVPLLNAQIKRGGPVTVTHPDMTRYFMTIPEAVQLVMQAGALGGSGETFILDMGDPVRIEDLAKDLILLHGLLPGDDIAIWYTGMRPGEKLVEELSYEQESLCPTKHPKIRMISDQMAPNYASLYDDIERLVSACGELDSAIVTEMLMDFAKSKRLYPSLDPSRQV